MNKFTNLNEEYVVPITEGMTIYFNDATSYYEERSKLNKAGFIMECNDSAYSVYILSCPYKSIHMHEYIF